MHYAKGVQHHSPGGSPGFFGATSDGTQKECHINFLGSIQISQKEIMSRPLRGLYCFICHYHPRANARGYLCVARCVGCFKSCVNIIAPALFETIASNH